MREGFHVPVGSKRSGHETYKSTNENVLNVKKLQKKRNLKRIKLEAKLAGKKWRIQAVFQVVLCIRISETFYRTFVMF